MLTRGAAAGSSSLLPARDFLRTRSTLRPPAKSRCIGGFSGARRQPARRSQTPDLFHFPVGSLFTSSVIIVHPVSGNSLPTAKKALSENLKPYDIEILVALADGESGCSWEEFMAEDFCDEDVLGHAYWFEAVAADSGIGASQVAWFPGKGEGAEGSRNVFGELRAGGGVDGVWGGEAFEGAEVGELGDDLFWLGQNGDRVRFEDGAGSVAGFELATEDEAGIGEFLFWEAERGAKEDFGWPAPGTCRAARKLPRSGWRRA
jgi:hypothetical protein